MKNYYCSKCGTLLGSSVMPSPYNCPPGGRHQWTNLGESGQNSYQCKKCGLLVKSKDIPHSFNCVAEGNHHWVKIQSEPNPGS